MYYAIVEGPPASEGKPFHVYKFRTLKEAHAAKVVDQHSVVYSEKKQLAEFFRKEELDAVWLALNKGRKEPPFGVKGFPSVTAAADALHAMVLKQAVAFAQAPQEPPVDPTPVKAAPPPKAQPRAKVETPMATEQLRVHGDEGIKIIKNFEGREASLRYKNMMLIQASKSVEEAVERLTKAGNETKVARDFIRWAAKSGYIELVSKY